jgi:hypothetical protein
VPPWFLCVLPSFFPPCPFHFPILALFCLTHALPFVPRLLSIFGPFPRLVSLLFIFHSPAFFF